MRLTEIEIELQRRLDVIARGTSYYVTQGAESGGKKLYGNSVHLDIPCDRYQPNSVDQIVRLFEELYADLTWFKLGGKIEHGGDPTGRLFRELLLGLDKQAPRGATLLR